MDTRKTLLEYLATLMTLFGVCMLILGTLTFLVGDDARHVSAMFALGSAGIPIEVTFQYFALLAVITGARYVFFNERIIRHMRIGLRAACLGGSCMGFTAIWIVAFGWFPPGMWQPWLMTAASFGACFAVAVAISNLKERQDTAKLEAALARLKADKEEEDAYGN